MGKVISCSLLVFLGIAILNNCVSNTLRKPINEEQSFINKLRELYPLEIHQNGRVQ